MNIMYLMQNMDFIENIHRKKTRKKITFDNVVNVVLIPSAKEMESIKNDIWWSRIDYTTFYVSARKEVSDFIEQHYPMNQYQAMKLLYQPSATVVSEDNTIIDCSAQI